MPTGYTHKIADDQSFEDFVLGCARAFGACIMQRDDPSSDKPKLQETSNYHTEKLLESQAQLAEFLGMTQDEMLDYGEQCKEEDIYRINERIQKNNALREKYDAMLEKVDAWIPPSFEHEELKQFMINQIQQSIDFDCKNSYNYQNLNKAQNSTPMEYYQRMIDSIAWNIKHHSEESLKDTERTLGRNKWITDLYESLGVEI